MRAWLIFIIMMLGCGNPATQKPEPAKNTNSVTNPFFPTPLRPVTPPETKAPTFAERQKQAMRMDDGAKKSAPAAAPKATAPGEKATAPKDKAPASQEAAKPTDPEKAKPSPCAAGQTYEKLTGRCFTPTPESYACVNETQLYDWAQRRCRPRSFREWCEANDNSYEVSITVAKVLNTLSARDCGEAEQILTRTKTLYFPPGGQKISNVAPLASLTQLTALYLPDNHITDIAPLSLLKNLETLSLRQNEIQDISPLLELPKLKRLDLGGNPITDWSPVSRMKQLVRVTTTAAPAPDAG